MGSGGRVSVVFMKYSMLSQLCRLRFLGRLRFSGLRPYLVQGH